MFPTNKSPKISYKFFCETCNYKCNKQSEINKHYSTRKHKILQNPTSEATSKSYICKCGKVYKHSSTMYAHRKKCSFIPSIEKHTTSSTGETAPSITTPHTTNTIIKETDPVIMEKMIAMFTQVLTQNQDFMQNVIGKVQGINTNSYNNNNNTNQFNIQMFLNEQCKNAMNLTDFIDSLPITADTYDNTIENGLTKTITTLITNGLNNMDITDRPIHCTDPARKTMYVKDNDVWEKDNELRVLLQGIRKLSIKQRTMINKWQDVNIGWDKDDNLQTRLTTLVCHSMTDIEHDEKEMNKIYRAISKNTYLTSEIKHDIGLLK